MFPFLTFAREKNLLSPAPKTILYRVVASLFDATTAKIACLDRHAQYDTVTTAFSFYALSILLATAVLLAVMAWPGG